MERRSCSQMMSLLHIKTHRPLYVDTLKHTHVKCINVMRRCTDQCPPAGEQISGVTVSHRRAGAAAVCPLLDVAVRTLRH